MVKKTVCVFAGDGVGPEVTAEAIKILNVVEKATGLEIDFQHKLMGGCAIDATGNPLPDDSLACAKAADAVLLGAVGGPKWGTGLVRPEQGKDTSCVDVADGHFRVVKDSEGDGYVCEFTALYVCKREVT
jgi:isocitrate/isopropylmalate dehydrogenase